MADQKLQIQTSAGSREGCIVVHLSGPLTIATLFEFQTLLRSERSPVLVLDLAGVPYLDSAGLGCLLGAHVSRQKDGRKLMLAGVSDRVKTVFLLTHVDPLFQFFDSVSQAEAALATDSCEKPVKPHVGFRIKPGAGWGG
ncbi:MAG: STAS domain-containing protein [Acidobacteriia bacterium]|nr:STAS domain-containing protein [Terriglobia bacterium]